MRVLLNPLFHCWPEGTSALSRQEGLRAMLSWSLKAKKWQPLWQIQWITTWCLTSCCNVSLRWALFFVAVYAMQPFPGHVIAPDKVHPRMFAKYRFRKHKECVRVSNFATCGLSVCNCIPYSQPKNLIQVRKQLRRLIRREAKRRRKLEELGVSYSFPGYRSTTMVQMPTQGTHTIFTEEW